MVVAPFKLDTYYKLKGWTPPSERHHVVQPRSDPSLWNVPTGPYGANFGGQDGDRRYPVQYDYSRFPTGPGFMYDTRDFVNHNLDSRSNDYNPRLIPDPSAVGGFITAKGRTPVNPNGTTNSYNPPRILHGLPPTISSANYFMQS